MTIEPVVSTKAEPAAILRRPVRVIDKLVPETPHRIIALGFLNRRILSILTVRLHRIGTIESGAPTVSAGKGLEKAEVLPPLRRDSAQAGVASHRPPPVR